MFRYFYRPTRVWNGNEKYFFYRKIVEALPEPTNVFERIPTPNQSLVIE